MHLSDREEIGILTPLSESYYGENDNLEEIDLCFKRIIFITKGRDDPNTKDLKIAKEMKSIQGHIAKLFNFEEVSISWIQQDLAANAYTFPVLYSSPLEFDFETIEDGNGLRWKNAGGKTLIATMYSSLVTLSDLNERELTGVLLHEIGHNFYVKSFAHLCIGKALSIYYLLTFFTVLGSDKYSNDTKLSFLLMKLKKFNAYMGGNSNHPVNAAFTRAMTSFIDTFEMMVVLVMSFMPFKIIDVLSRTLGRIAIDPITILSNIDKLIYGYDNEKYADNFATAYGYGKEVASTETKFARKATVLDVLCKESPIIAVYLDFFRVQTTVLSFIFDPHPQTAFRIYDQAKMLESELEKNKNLPPKSRAKMLEDIKFIKNQYDNISNEYKNNNKYFTEYFIKFNKMFCTGDYRELAMYTNNYDVKDINTSDSILGKVNSWVRDAIIMISSYIDVPIPNCVKRIINMI